MIKIALGIGIGFAACYYSLFFMPVNTCSVTINDVRLCVVPGMGASND